MSVVQTNFGSRRNFPLRGLKDCTGGNLSTGVLFTGSNVVLQHYRIVHQELQITLMDDYRQTPLRSCSTPTRGSDVSRLPMSRRERCPEYLSFAFIGG